MKKVTYCLMTLFITLLVSVATLEAATVITSLPYTITTQGSYIINQNLKANWHGIKVQANNVTIDLNGYSIYGVNASGGYGVYMNGRSNVEIRNGTIRNFGSHGIYEENNTSGNSHRVINVRVMNNKGHGIHLLGSNYMVKDCTASNNRGYGITVGLGSTVSGNAAYSNGQAGINVGLGSTVSGNTAYSNVSDGILAGAGSTVSGNTAYGHVNSGITADAGSTISGNTAYNNGYSGIFAGAGSTVKNNSIYYNGREGIYLGGYNLVDGNTAYQNNQAGGYANISSCPTCTFGVNSAP